MPTRWTYPDLPTFPVSDKLLESFRDPLVGKNDSFSEILIMNCFITSISGWVDPSFINVTETTTPYQMIRCLLLKILKIRKWSMLLPLKGCEITFAPVRP